MNLKLNRIIWLLVLQVLLIIPVALKAADQTHTVRKGDTLYGLSKQYGTTVDQLVKLNKLQGSSLSIGQKLVIKSNVPPTKPKPVPAEVPKPVSPPPVPAPEPKPESVSPAETGSTPPPTVPLSEDYYYTIKAKDNLYRISVANGVAIKDMLAWNGFANSQVQIHPGDRIIVKDPSGNPAKSGEPSSVAVASPAVTPQVAIPDSIVVEKVYVVQRKDNLFRIATANGMTVDELKKLNNLSGNDLKVGQRIYLAGKKRPDGSITPIQTQSPKKILTDEDVQKRDKIRTDLTMPVEAKVISEYGLRNGRPHKGMDLGAKQGTPIFAVLDGTVVYSGVQGAYGNVVVIEHPDFAMTVYAHNEKNLVSVNDVVKQSQQIATVGATGNAQGSHLHFEYRLKGKAINPRKVLPFK